MIYIELNPVEYITGIFSLIFVVIAVSVGIIITSKYFKYKEKNLLLVGLAWMTLSSPWWDTAINFILIITLDFYLNTLILITMGFLVPLGFILWMISFSNLAINKNKTPLLVLSGVYTFLYEIYIIYSLIINPAYIGTKAGPFKFEYTTIMEILIIVLLLVFIFTGLYFSVKSLKEKDSEIKLKGSFLLCAFISFTIGAVIDLLAGAIIQIVIGMTFLMLSSIFFYLGYILPDKVKKIFLK